MSRADEMTDDLTDIEDGIEDFINSYEPSRCKFCGELIQWGFVVDENGWRPLRKDFMGFHRCVAATMGDEMTDEQFNRLRPKEVRETAKQKMKRVEKAKVEIVLSVEEVDWCNTHCSLTQYMIGLGWCDTQVKLRLQGKECPRLIKCEKPTLPETRTGK